jgi:hypothetical protein
MIYKWAQILELSMKKMTHIKDFTMSRLEFKNKSYWALHKEDVTHQVEVLAESHERSPPR